LAQASGPRRRPTSSCPAPPACYTNLSIAIRLVRRTGSALLDRAAQRLMSLRRVADQHSGDPLSTSAPERGRESVATPGRGGRALLAGRPTRRVEA
jgi:hypothetical protein